MTVYKTTAILVIVGMFMVGGAVAESLKSYRFCRQCHDDIFQLWNESLHANSSSNPTFKASYMTLVMDHGSDAGRLCLQCHAPAAYINKDFDISSVSAVEGVSCSFCHSIASVNPGVQLIEYYNLDTTGVVYGPYEASANTTGHAIKYSSLHLSAAACAGCHQYVNDNGIEILGTFGEWKESPYPQQEIHCQNCHMPMMSDLSVANTRKVSAYYVTAHEFRGGHSKINLEHAVDMKTEMARIGTRLNVTVFVTNAESGHKLPTGIPMRKLILTVALKTSDGTEISSARKVYRKVLTNKFGTILEDAPDMFQTAAGIYSDNRIKPKETRQENFVFDLPNDIKNYVIETTLNYEYTRQILTDESVKIQMARNVVSSWLVKK